MAEGAFSKTKEMLDDVCPEWKRILKYRDKVLRGQRQIGGKRKPYMLSRLKFWNEGCRNATGN